MRQLAWGISFLTLALVTAATVLVVLKRDSIGNLYQANAVEIVLPISWVPGEWRLFEVIATP